MLENIIFGNTVMQYIEVIAITVGSLIAAKIIYYLLKTVVGAAVKNTQTRLDDELLDNAEKPIIAIIVVTGLYLGLTRLTLGSDLATLNNATYIAIAIILTWLALRLSNLVVSFWLKPMTEKTKSHIDDQLVPIVGVLLKIIVIALALYIVLTNFNYDITALVAGLGVGGLAVALATKDYLENIIGGLTIFTDKPFKIGDLVEVNGTKGFIKEVGIRTTRLLTYDNTLVVMPNTQMVTNKLVNISEPNRTIGISATIGVTYDTSIAKIEKGKDIIKKAVTSTKGIDKNYPPLVFFTGFGDSALKVWFKYKIADYGNKLSITDEINTKIKKGFEKAKIEMAFPTQTIHVKK